MEVEASVPAPSPRRERYGNRAPVATVVCGYRRKRSARRPQHSRPAVAPENRRARPQAASIAALAARATRRTRATGAARRAAGAPRAPGGCARTPTRARELPPPRARAGEAAAIGASACVRGAGLRKTAAVSRRAAHPACGAERGRSRSVEPLARLASPSGVADVVPARSSGPAIGTGPAGRSIGARPRSANLGAIDRPRGAWLACRPERAAATILGRGVAARGPRDVAPGKTPFTPAWRRSCGAGCRPETLASGAPRTSAPLEAGSWRAFEALEGAARGRPLRTFETLRATARRRALGTLVALETTARRSPPGAIGALEGR